MRACVRACVRWRLFLQVLPYAAAQNGRGRHGHLVRLFLDGEWQATCVDAHLPCLPETDAKPGGRRGTGANPERLAFSRAAGRVLWCPLVEKAYAKAHGCYHAISGGQVRGGRGGAAAGREGRGCCSSCRLTAGPTGCC
eukprot:SAG22_NODE_607_length_8603_cov_4.554327_4_plen_139_part_00